MKSRYKMGVLGMLAMCMQPALGADFKAGDWTLSLGGNINAYYTFVDCDGGEVGGLALGGRALGCGGKDSRTTIGNGLLPSSLVTSAASTQGGYDIKALIGIYVHAATDSAISQNSEVDVRQAFFTFGKADFGTVKLGRDNGIFGANAILNDMTLMGAGAPVQATQRGRVALGHIGAGYAYFGQYGQIVYSTPPMASGLGVDIGVMSPVDDTVLSNLCKAARYYLKLTLPLSSCFAGAGFTLRSRARPAPSPPQADTVELTAMFFKLIAALMSRSCVMPHAAQVH